MKLTILVSGSGTNLQNIIDATKDGRLPNTEIIKVIADRDCKGLDRAENEHIPTALVQRGKDFSERLEKEIPEDTDYIVLAGLLSILSPEITEKWKGKIVNIHPSLLPKYGGKGMYGMKVHQAVLENGEKESGATVHYVTAGIDEGDIILQKSFEIPEDADVDTIAKRVHEIEYEIFIQALQMLE